MKLGNPVATDSDPQGHRHASTRPADAEHTALESPSDYALRRPPAQLCLPSPELEPELLLLSPIIPPGGAFTPSDPQSLEALDPTASAQLLDNIMAWFNHNITPQNNPQSLALIPSPPTTESDSSPDAPTEAAPEAFAAQSAFAWRPPEGQLDPAHSCPSRPSTLELDNRASDEEKDEEGDRGAADDASPHAGAPPADLDLVLQLEEDQSPLEWEEKVHLV